MATCAVSANFTDAEGTPLSDITVFTRIPAPIVNGTSLIVPAQLTAISDASGNVVITLQQSISVMFTVQYPPVGTEPQRIVTYTGNIPATTTANFTSVIVQEV